ncbi:type VI secretion system tip protein VgrG [Paraburkholderia sediminicola]|uniref:Type VI secretion system tip protein VgrG n=1 Tax=Paraburkholderia rhynchosiae TaxID=487049 RepID=A0ACC7N893_9BURK
MRPWLWLATKNCDSRIFQNLSVVEITDQILKESYPYPVEMRLGAPGLKNGYPKRDYVRQFWQSDYEYLSMLWREWGIYYLFDGMTLVLCDSPGSHRKHDNAYDTIRYQAPDGTRIDEEHRPKKKPRCAGETAIVVGPDDQPMWVDSYARIKIRFVWDRLSPDDQNASCWVRVSSPWQGNGFGAIYLPRIGQEITVSYHEGDVDKPYVSDRMVNNRNQPPWNLPDNQALSGMLSRGLNGGQSNHVALDDTPGKLQAQIASDHAQSRLVLGYNTRVVSGAGRRDARGEGWELATNAHGVARANMGIVLTTEARDGATAPAKDMGETVARLTQARDIYENLAALARQHEAQEQETSQSDVSKAVKAQNDAIRGGAANADSPFPQLSRPDMLLASAAGFGLTAAEGAHIASVEHTAITAGGHVSIATAKSFLASAVNGLRMFAQNLGIYLTAAAGKIRIQAQSDGMDLIAERVLNIISRTDAINLTASKKIVFHVANTKVVIDPEGYKVYTDGAHLVHAGSHQTDGPLATPLRMPPTDIAQAKVAAHHVLIEHDTGFALPNQPYRITLDDGQVIQGVSNALGETSLVTSNAIAFATVEMFAASEPDKVIAVSTGPITRDSNQPFTGAAPNAEKRSTRVAGKTVSTPEQGATTEDRPPEFVSCDPMNFGLRSCHFINGSTQADAPAGMPLRRNIEYQVTKTYTAAIKSALKGIDWHRLTWPLASSAVTMIQNAVKRPLQDALGSGPFGLPQGNASSRESGSVIPRVVIVIPVQAESYNLRQDVSAAFIGNYWLIAINESEIAKIVALKDKPAELDDRLRAFADTLYHEARHCQQYFWMFSLLQHFPDDYRDLPDIQKVYSAQMSDIAFKAAGSTSLPKDERVHIGLHRMLVFHYYWLISYMQDTPGGDYLRTEVLLAEKKVCDLLKVSPEAAQKMAKFETGYRSQLHEEDAYACAEVVQAYWQNPDNPFVRNPGTCTADYAVALRIVGARG